MIQKGFDRLITERIESGLRKWAASNAYTLVFIMIMFAITWAVIIAAAIWEASR